MIGLLINDNYLPIRDKKISLRGLNPMFADDGVPGLVSFPFTVANTPESSKMLDYPALITNTLNFSRRIKNAQITFKGSPIFWGELKILRAGKESFQVVFYSGSANFTDIANRSLQSLTIGPDITISPNIVAFANDCATKDISQTPIQFPPHRNPSFWSDERGFYIGSPTTDEADREQINYHQGGTYRQLVEPMFALTESPFSAYYNTFNPWLYFANVLKAVFHENNFTLESAFLDIPEIKQLLLFNNRVIDGTLISSTIVGGSPTPCLLHEPGNTIKLSHHLPNVLIGDFLRYCQRMFKLCFDYPLAGNQTVKAEPFKTLYTRPASVDFTELETASDDIEMRENFYRIIKEIRGEEINDRSLFYWKESNLTFKNGDPAQDISTGAGFFVTNVIDYYLITRGWTIIHASENGFANTSQAAINNECSLRLAFYRGLFQDTDGFNTPLITDHDVNDITATPIPGAEYSFRSAERIFNDWHKEYAQMMQDERNVKKAFMLTLPQIQMLSAHDKIHVRNANYFWRQFDVDLDERIHPTRFELVRV